MNLDELKAFPWLKPDGSPRPEWQVFTAPTLPAAWDAAVEATQGTGVDAALNAAVEAARAAARDEGWDTAWNAAWDAVMGTPTWYQAWDGARGTGLDVAQDATRDMALLYWIETAAPGIDASHIAHARARVEVWRKGYALLCDVGGVLYVYAKEG